MRLSSFVGASTRRQIDRLSRRWNLGNADTLRRLALLGLGNTIADADELNRRMAARRAAAEQHFGIARTPGPREKAAIGNRTHAPVVAVRLPSSIAKTVRAEGGLRVVIERGLRIAT